MMGDLLAHFPGRAPNGVSAFVLFTLPAGQKGKKKKGGGEEMHYSDISPLSTHVEDVRDDGNK